eukprot:749079-Hanusia_phi.AAC.2
MSFCCHNMWFPLQMFSQDVRHSWAMSSSDTAADQNLSTVKRTVNMEFDDETMGTLEPLM